MSDKRNVVVRGPYEGELIHVAGDRYRFLATKGDTDGQYALWEAFVPPGGGPPRHRHSREEEGFYIIEGKVTVYVDEDEYEAAAGSFVNLPKGSWHSFRNSSKQPAKMLILVSPGGMEEMFRRAGQVVTELDATVPPFGAAEKQKLVEVAAEYGIELQPPADD